MRLPRGRFGTVVRVEHGSVLVTREGDPEDHVLGAGDEIVLPAAGLAVAWAFTDAAVSVREAASTASSPPTGTSRHRSARAAQARAPAALSSYGELV